MAFLVENNFLNPDLSLYESDSPEVLSLKSGDWFVIFFLFFKNKNNATRRPITMVPPIEPTKPPINFAFFSEGELEVLLSSLTDDVGTVTNEVIVVSDSSMVV